MNDEMMNLEVRMIHNSLFGRMTSEIQAATVYIE